MGLSHTSEEDLWSFCPPAERRSLELGYREGGQSGLAQKAETASAAKGFQR